jgi:hypothetical protein
MKNHVKNELLPALAKTYLEICIFVRQLKVFENLTSFTNARKFSC